MVDNINSNNSISDDILKTAIDSVHQFMSCDITIATISSNEHVVRLKKLFDSQKQNELLIKSLNEHVVDVIWFYGNQLSADSSTPPNDSKWQQLSSLIKDLYTNKVLDAMSLRISLDLNLLYSAGLAADEKTILKHLVRINTRILYRQQKYNLLREETEGFSKLVATLATMPLSNQNCENHIKNVLAIIGQFDLDPNRVLEVILDAYEQQTDNTSFLKLIKYTRSPNVVHILGLKFIFYTKETAKNTPTTTAPTTNTASSSTPTIAPSTVTSSNKPGSNAQAAPPTIPVSNDPILPQQEEDVTLPAPKSLYSVAAALIGSNIIDLDALLPYTSPDIATISNDCEFDDVLRTKEINEYGVISLNAGKKSESNSSTTTSAASSSTNMPSNGNSSSSNPETLTSVDHSDVNYHLVGLASALISLKCFHKAEEILVSLDAAGVDVMHFESIKKQTQQLLLWQISDIYTVVSFDKFKLTRGSNVNNKSLYTDDDKANDMFVDRCHKIRLTDIELSLFPQQVLPILRLIGHRIADDPILFTQICRLFKYRLDRLQLTNEGIDSSMITYSEEHDNEITIICDLVGSVLLPSLTANEGHVFMGSLIWSIISLLPFHRRYEIYDSWYNNKTGKHAMNIKHLDLVFIEAKVLHSTKALIRRLVKENTKLIGRQLARLTHYSPIVVFEYILNQIEYYDNLIPYVVEALKYTSDLSKDILSYFFIVQLKSSPNSNKVTISYISETLDSSNGDISPWFLTLSKFIAYFYKRYPSTDLKGLFHLLLQCLSNGEVGYLLLLKQVLCVTGGCETLNNISKVQLDGLSGGKILRAEVMGASVKDPPSKRAIKVLRDAFITSGIAIPLLLFIAQIRNKVIHTQMVSTAGSGRSGNETNVGIASIKMISMLYDITQDVLMIFSDFLIGNICSTYSPSSSNASSSSGTSSNSISVTSSHSSSSMKQLELLISMLPSFKELVDDIGVSLPIAFQICRPIFRICLTHGFDPIKCQSNMPNFLQSWHPLNADFIEYISNQPQLVDNNVWKSFSPKLYILFWSLSLYDISTPTTCYDLENKRLKDRYSELSTSHLNIIGQSASEADRLNRQRKSDMNKIMSTLKDLTTEHETQKKHVESMKKMIEQVKDSFFFYSNSIDVDNSDTMMESHVQNESQSTNDMKVVVKTIKVHKTHAEVIAESLTQHCVVFRSNISALDAVFCTQFLFLLHDIESKYLSTLSYMDKFVKSLTPQLFSATEAESSFLGFLMNDLLEKAFRWQLSQTLYELEAGNKIGFATDLSPEESTMTKRENDRITLDQYKLVFKHWQTYLKNIIKHALQSPDYMNKRSALLFITHISQYFPTTTSVGQEILNLIDSIEKKLQQTKTLQDLHVMAKSVGALLKRRSSSWIQDVPAVIPVPIGKISQVTNTTTSSNNIDSASSHIHTSSTTVTKKPLVPSKRESNDSLVPVDGFELGEEPEPLPILTIPSSSSTIERERYGKDKDSDRNRDNDRYQGDRVSSFTMNNKDHRDIKDNKDISNGGGYKRKLSNDNIISMNRWDEKQSDEPSVIINDNDSSNKRSKSTFTSVPAKNTSKIIQLKDNRKEKDSKDSRGREKDHSKERDREKDKEKEKIQTSQDKESSSNDSAAVSSASEREKMLRERVANNHRSQQQPFSNAISSMNLNNPSAMHKKYDDMDMKKLNNKPLPVNSTSTTGVSYPMRPTPPQSHSSHTGRGRSPQSYVQQGQSTWTPPSFPPRMQLPLDHFHPPPPPPPPPGPSLIQSSGNRPPYNDGRDSRERAGGRRRST